MSKKPLKLPEGVELNLDFDSLSDEQKAEILAVIEQLNKSSYSDGKKKFP